jgi:hypothetical protein
VAIDRIVASTGKTRAEAATELHRRGMEGQTKNKTMEEFIANSKRFGKMNLGKGRGPKKINGKLPDWIVVWEVNPLTTFELNDPGPRCSWWKNDIAAQLREWGIMTYSTVQAKIARFKIGDCNETTFFIKGVKGENKGRIWKLSYHPEKPSEIKCIDENLATEETQEKRDSDNSRGDSRIRKRATK